MRGVVGVLLAALVAALWFSLTATHGLELQDEGHILLRSQRVLEKSLPNRDFADVYGPGVSVVNAILLHVFDRRIVAVRWSLVAVKAAAVAAVWVAADEVATPAVAAVATAFAILAFGRATWNLNTPYAALYVLALGLVALAATLRARAAGSSVLAGLAGLAVGTAVLFKYSLATMYAASLALALVATAILEPDEPRGRRSRLTLSIAFVCLLALPFVLHEVPFRFVGPVDYLLFFAPAHALGAMVLLAGPEAPGRARDFGLRAMRATVIGVSIVPLASAAIYAGLGALTYAVADELRSTRMYGFYAAGIGYPSPGATAFMGGVAALAAAVALAARRRWRAAGVSAGLAALGLTVGARDPAGAGFVAAADMFAHVLPSLGAWALLAVCAPALRRSPRPAWVVPAVIVSFFHHATGFQIFPRAGFNALLAMPALAPTVAVLGAAAWWRLEDASLVGARRAVVLGCIAVPVGALVSPAIRSVVDLTAAPKIAIPFPETDGLSIREDHAEGIRSLRALVDFLQREPERPVFLMNNDAMILFLSRSRSLLPNHELMFELMGYFMLNPHVLSTKLAMAVVNQLDGEADPIVILKDDGTTDNIRFYMPPLKQYLERNFAPEFATGAYQTLRRRAPRPAPGSPPPT